MIEQPDDTSSTQVLPGVKVVVGAPVAPAVLWAAESANAQAGGVGLVPLFFVGFTLLTKVAISPMTLWGAAREVSGSREKPGV